MLLTLPFDGLLMVGLLSTFIGCAALVWTQRWHARWTIDGTQGVQKFHTAPTPRVAGLAIFLGLWLCLKLAPPQVTSLLTSMWIASIPAFIFGLMEDLTKRVGVRERLLATMASGVFAWWMTGISLNRLDVWGLDTLLVWLPFSVAFTAVAIGGVANAVNIIDGFNGLASGVVLICLASLGACASAAGDEALVQVCVVLGAVLIGFALVNFPLGKIFLGDGGAYLVGFCLGWIAVLLPMRNPSISPWASMLACAYPVLEVLFSMLRRYRRNLHPGHPDRLHMHSLIKTRIIRKRLVRFSPVLRNSAVSPLVWLMAAVPASLAVLFHDEPSALMIALASCALGYALCYRRLVYFRWF
jgi:UDP-N-acetylmuramyl pentapeptide phosphotransferase/UDP-N-acetylglucosamine-1-phosphate transferase